MFPVRDYGRQKPKNTGHSAQKQRKVEIMEGKSPKRKRNTSTSNIILTPECLSKYLVFLCTNAPTALCVSYFLVITAL